MKFGSLLTALVMALAVADRADAFLLTGYSWPQAYLGAPVTLTYSFNPQLYGGLLDDHNQPVSTNVIRASIEEALTLWASVAPLNFVEVPDAGPTPDDFDYIANPGDPQLRFGQHLIDGFGNTKGHAYYPYSTFTGLPGDVHFDNGDRWALQGTLTYPDLLGCAEHEIGHALGLDHSADMNAVMYPTFHRMNGLGTGFLTADDIAGMQAIYGAGHGSVTPLSVPEPASAALAIVAACLFAYRAARGDGNRRCR